MATRKPTTTTSSRLYSNTKDQGEQTIGSKIECLQNQLQYIAALQERNKSQLESFIDEQDQWDSMENEEQQLLLSKPVAVKELSILTLLQKLHSLIERAPQNGIETPTELQLQIKDLCTQLQQVNPNPKPCLAPSLLNGFWYMLYTDYSPPGPSSGKLGPFVGNVYQEIDLDEGVARNIFRLQNSLLPVLNIIGELTAFPTTKDDGTTVAITFDKVGTKVCGLLPLGPNIEFPKGQEIRLWNHIYVDDTYRILFAKNNAPAPKEENDDGSTITTKAVGNDRGFLYIMKRADNERFVTNIH
jgi:hypothetical protein